MELRKLHFIWALALAFPAAACQPDLVARLSPTRALEWLAEPVPLNALYEIYGVSYPLGKSAGALYHVRPKDHVDKLKDLEGSAFVSAGTEYTDAPAFYAALGFKARNDPRIGNYWYEIPSAELMQANIDRWNARFRGDPKRLIHLKYKTVGAHNQVDMAKYQGEGYVGMADPYSVHTEPYAVTNSAPPTPADHNRLVLNPTTGRVVEANGLFFHDVGQMVNSPFLTKSTFDSMSEMSRFYVEVFDLFKQAAAKGKDLRMANAEAMAMREALIKYEMNGRSPVNLDKPGVAATRYVSLQLMYSQSSYHGYEHLLGWLIREKEGLDPRTFAERSRGSTFQREAVFHLMRLGIRAPGSQPYFMSPVGVLTWSKASDKGGPLTLERALDFIVNTDRERAATLLRDLGEAYKDDPEIAGALKDLGKKYDTLLTRRLSPEEIRALARETRDRYEAIAAVSP